MTPDDATEGDWIVLLEVADRSRRSTIDSTTFERLLNSWAGPPPTTLHSPGRYALQIPVCALDPASALSVAMRLWKEALGRSGLPEWGLLRAEIVTPEELEKELRSAESAFGHVDALPASPAGRQDPVTDELLRRALHDSVTGLPDRELFLDVVRQTLATSHSAPATHMVIVVHLDGLDAVTPSPDYPVADEVLVEVVRRLRKVVRRADTIGRLGPVELVLLVEAPSWNAVPSRIVEVLRSPLLQHGRALALRTSVGVAATSLGADADQMILMAEVATAAAREAGGDCYMDFAACPDSV